MAEGMNVGATIQLPSGNEMPPIGLGTWQLTGEKAVNAVREALRIGYRLIDTSSDYGNFEEIRSAIADSEVGREDMFIATKVEEADDAYEAAKQYVGRLGLKYADLIIIHRPPMTGAGQELWRGLMQARDKGITKDIGVSNYSADQMQVLFDDTGEWPAINQIEWTPFGHSQEMLAFCKEHGIVIQAYSPLVHTGEVDQTLVEELARKYGKTPSQIVLRWDIQLGVVPIPKASSREHLEENLSVFDFELADEDMKRLAQLNQKYSALGPSLTYV